MGVNDSSSLIPNSFRNNCGNPIHKRNEKPYLEFAAQVCLIFALR